MIANPRMLEVCGVDTRPRPVLYSASKIDIELGCLAQLLLREIGSSRQIRFRQAFRYGRVS